MSRERDLAQPVSFLPGFPDGCPTRAFAEDPLKVQDWPAGVETKPGPLTKVDDLAISLMLHARAARMLQDQDK